MCVVRCDKKLTACRKTANCQFFFIRCPWRAFNPIESPCRRAGGTLHCQFSNGKQRTVNEARSIRAIEKLPQKRDSKTVGFGGLLVTFPAAEKSLRPQAEASCALSHRRGRGKPQIVTVPRTARYKSVPAPPARDESRPRTAVFRGSARPEGRACAGR